MNITYLWTAPSGYLAACIRALQRNPNVKASLITWRPGLDSPFSGDSIQVSNHRVLSETERGDYQSIKRIVADTDPDVVVVAGWAHAPYVRIIQDPSFRSVRFVIGADTPIRFDLRQLVARLKIGRLLQRADAICVPGERAFQVMRYWKVPGHKITRLLYGIDYDLFSHGTGWRWDANRAWQKRFTFVGRYMHVKGVDLLVDAYRQYRVGVSNPWPLTVCGAGPLANMFQGQEGIEDRGFTQPEDLRKVFQESAVFVLPSRIDPWGQVIVEAAAAGLPIICTQTCGASAELVRDYHSGLIVPPEDSASLAAAFTWMHEHADRLPQFGTASQSLARPFGADRWAENQAELAFRLCKR